MPYKNKLYPQWMMKTSLRSRQNRLISPIDGEKHIYASAHVESDSVLLQVEWKATSY